MKTVAEGEREKERARERERERGEVSVDEFTWSMFECLWLGCGSTGRLGWSRDSPNEMLIRSPAE